MSSPYLQRKALSSDFDIIIGVGLQIGLLLIVINLISSEPNSADVFHIMGIYGIVFLALSSFYWPSDQKVGIYSGVIVAVVIRILLLNIYPITSTDFHRNLMFGNVFAVGVDPYSTTGLQIQELINSGEIQLIVPYIGSWNTHAFDYPSAAIWLFWFIIQLATFLPIFDAFFWGKFILNLMDFGCGYLIFEITRKRLHWDTFAAAKACVIYLLNPFSVFQVALEGQFEVLPLLAFLGALYFFLDVDLKRATTDVSNSVNVYLGTLLFVISILAKYYSLVALPGILWLLRDRRLVYRFIGSFVVFIFYLSIPFVVSGPYVINFFNFQADRNSNPLSTGGVAQLLGYRFELSFWVYIITGAVAIFTLLQRQEKEFSLASSSVLLSLFLFHNNSLFPWYFLWLLNTYPVLRTYDSYLEVVLWGILIFIYLIVWLPTSEILWFLSLMIIVIGAIITHQSFPIGTEN